MSWFEKLLPGRIRTDAEKKKGVPEGIWSKCDDCAAILYRSELERNLYVCPKCASHQPINAQERANLFMDPESQERLAEDVSAVDWLKFKDTKKYKDRLSAAQKKTSQTEALLVLKGTLFHLPIVGIFFDFDFMGGSMGSAVGERFVQAVESCLATKRPLVCFVASGGARMQEGIISLLQMAKTSAALAKLDRAKIPYISVLTHPTMGGVSASLAMLGDIIITEPKALIGFAGPRVIEQTVRETLPEGFQRSEFLLDKGAVDMIVDRREMRKIIYRLLLKLK